MKQLFRVSLKKVVFVFLFITFFSASVNEIHAQTCCSPTQPCPPPERNYTVVCRPAQPGEPCSGSGICIYSYSGWGVDWSELIPVAAPSFSADSTPGDIISAVIPFIYAIASFLLLIYLVLGGYQVLISQGDPKQMAAGREKITYAIVGFILMFAAYWITKLVGEILDIEQIRDLFP